MLRRFLLILVVFVNVCITLKGLFDLNYIYFYGILSEFRPVRSELHLFRSLILIVLGATTLWLLLRRTPAEDATFWVFKLSRTPVSTSSVSQD